MATTLLTAVNCWRGCGALLLNGLYNRELGTKLSAKSACLTFCTLV